MIDQAFNDSKWLQSAMGEIAEKMGLRGIDDLAPGHQLLRLAQGPSDGAVLIVHTWRAVICPAFEDPALIVVCCAKENEFRGEMTPAFHKAGMALIDPEHQAVIDLEQDPVRRAAANLDPLDYEGRAYLDGIGYFMEFNSEDCQTSLRFSNPTVDCLVKLERSLLQLANRIAEQSRIKALRKYVKRWED